MGLQWPECQGQGLLARGCNILVPEENNFVFIEKIAQPLDIGIVAQAVESESLILLLEEMGFAAYQGYANGRPAPIA